MLFHLHSIYSARYYSISKFRNAVVCAKAVPAIVHYAGRYKPWEFPNIAALMTNIICIYQIQIFQK